MTSDKQIDANRRNAKNSTGPTTEDGKKQSRMNALKHGAYLQHGDHVTATILKEDPTALAELTAELEDSLEPNTAIERSLASHQAQLIVNQQRIHRLTAALVSSAQVEVEIDKAIGPRRYEYRLWNSLRLVAETIDEPADPSFPYEQLAQEFYGYLSPRFADVPTAEIDEFREYSSVADAWRQVVVDLVEAWFGPCQEALPAIVEECDERRPGFERETRVESGIEAKRILALFDNMLDVQERQARLVSRGFDAYYQLKALSAKSKDTDTT